MTEHTLGPLAERLPEALLLLGADGQILDINQTGRSIVGNNVVGRNIQSLVPTESRADLQRYLDLCSASTELIPGALQITTGDRNGDYRCDTGLLSPAGPAQPATILMRLTTRSTATQGFQLLSRRIEELGQQVELRMRAEQLLDAQKTILEQIVHERPLLEILEQLTLFIDDYSRSGAMASILLYDRRKNSLRHAAAPKLPQDYCAAIDGIEIGPNVGSCGAAAYLRQAVLADDLSRHPNWAPYRELAAQAGLGACFSLPITGHDDELLGTFALYYSTPRRADAEDLHIAALLTRTAALAIERSRVAEEKNQYLDRERRLRAEAEDANRSKDEFLAMVSHELRNPLNAILGWSRVLTMQPDSETGQKGIEAIERNATLQAQLIEEILDYSRITAGKLQLEIEPADITRMIAAAVDSARPVAAAKEVSIYCDLEALDSTPVAFDAPRMQQVMNNLLSNAIKFTPAGGSVRVSGKYSDNYVHVSVMDTGCGIDPKFLPHMFERFRQQAPSQDRANEGLGLGLAISRHIVQLHHGEIVARSDGRGKGATFEVRLPRRFAWSHKRKPEVVSAPDLAGVRLLAVDDAADTRSLLQAVFETAGARVALAANGEQALEMLHRNPPDILLCDIGMPGMNGYEVVRRLRLDEQSTGRQRIAAIALTAYARGRDRQRALNAGFDAHMAKPIDPAQLMQVVADTVTRRSPSD